MAGSNYRAAQPAEPEGPTAEEVAKQQEQERLAELEKQLAERDKALAVAQARLETERDVASRFAQNKQTAQPTPNDMYQAQQELNISDEELLDPNTARAAIERLVEHQARKIQSEYASTAGEVMGNLAQTAFEVQMNSLASEDFYEDLEPYIRDYFQQNPQEVYKAGRVKQVYEQLVGKNYKVLSQNRATPDNVDADPEPQPSGSSINEAKSRYRTSRVVDPATRTPSPSERPAGKKKTVKLDERRQAVMDKFRALGVDMTPEEWDDIESGRKYPKAIAADIQVGISAPNVEYE